MRGSYASPRRNVQAAPTNGETVEDEVNVRPAEMPSRPIEGPAAWKGNDLATRPDQWLFELTPDELREIDSAVKLV